ncbi:hypothetical protein ACFQAS_08075 [Halopenitus salinus]
MVDLIDVVLEGAKDVVDWVTDVFMEGVHTGYDTLSVELFGTPTPRTDGPFVFGSPSNEPWITLYETLVGGEIMILALLTLTICVQGRHTIRIFNIGSAYESRKTRKTAWAGAFLIITWYWVSAVFLYLVDGFTIALLPSLDSLARVMIDFLSASLSNPGLSLIFAIVGGISMWLLQALYYIREVLLFVYIYGMPIALAIGYGNVPVLSEIALGFARRFVPLAALPLPAAIVFKGYDLLYTGGTLTPANTFLRYLVAMSLPMVAVFITWRTFKYATPVTARVMSGATKGAILVGGVAAGAYVGGGSTAAAAARFGPKAAAGHALAQRVTQRNTADDQTESTPSYRRTENNPERDTT